MNRTLRLLAIMAMLIAAAVISGCGKQAAHETETARETEMAHPEEHGAGMPVVPANTSAEILAQIRDQETQLAVAIESGRLADLHRLAFNVNDLVKALADRTQGLPEAQAERLKQAADSVAALTTRLDHYGDSGNLGASKTHFTALQATLDQIRALDALPGASLGASKTPPRAQNVILAGEIVDPQCYFTHDSRGKEHADCAAMCARGGQGLAFLEEKTGKVYPLIASGHGKSQNEGLIDDLGKPVQVTGVAYNKDGNVVLQIQSVETLR